jgi:hypothetical protein
VKKAQAEQLREISFKIGTIAVEAATVFLPRIAAGLKQTDKAISFGLSVKVSHGKDGTLECEIAPKAPKIPTADIDPANIVLKFDKGGQLEFLFDGSMSEMTEAIAHDAAQKDDGYTAQPNARTTREADTGEAARTESAPDGERVH